MRLSFGQRKQSEPTSRSHYLPLDADNGDRSSSEEDIELKGGTPGSEFRALPSWRSSNTINVIACGIALLSTLLHLYFSFFPSRSQESTQILRRPTQFISLSSIPYSTHPLLSPHFSNITLTTFPTIVQPIYRFEPNHVFYEESADPRRQFTRFGTISPEDRRVVANAGEDGQKISTIVQFRTRDYGMEKCRLRLFLDPNHRHDPSLSSEDQSRRKDWILSGNTSQLLIWILETPLDPETRQALSKLKGQPGYESHKYGWIDQKKLSYATAHAIRKEPLTTFNLTDIQLQEGSNKNAEGGMLESPEFECLEDSILTFEIVCVSPACEIDWWQDRRMPVGAGIILHQSSSL